MKINAQKYLESIKAIEVDIEVKTGLVQKLRDRLASLSVPMDKEQVSHTKNTTVMAETVATIVDIEKEIDVQTCNLYMAEARAYQLLDKITADKACILISRFLEGKSTATLGSEMFMTRRQVQRKIKEALEELQVILDTA